jgi:hypothetical protein
MEQEVSLLVNINAPKWVIFKEVLL